MSLVGKIFIQSKESDVGGYKLVQPKFGARIRKLRRHGQHVFNFANEIPRERWSQTLCLKGTHHLPIDRMLTFQANSTSMRVRTFDPNGFEFSIKAKVRGMKECS
ncbi:hypothetical protein GQ457_01G016300 [Hibiscus cannabinus]